MNYRRAEGGTRHRPVSACSRTALPGTWVPRCYLVETRVTANCPPKYRTLSSPDKRATPNSLPQRYRQPNSDIEPLILPKIHLLSFTVVVFEILKAGSSYSPFHQCGTSPPFAPRKTPSLAQLVKPHPVSITLLSYGSLLLVQLQVSSAPDAD